MIRGCGALAAFAAVCLAVCAEQTRFNGMKNFGSPGDVEVVVRTQAKTGRRFVFVLNRGAATKGSLAGRDFPSGTSFVDAISGGPAANGFSLGAFGYRVLHTGPLQ